MPRFTLRGLTLTLPDAALRRTLGKALGQGRYEHLEADALLAHLTPTDRVLDLGAGLGLLAVEAGPETMGLARANLAADGFSGVRLIVLETPAKLCGPDGVDRLHRALLAQGFAIEPNGTVCKTLVYCRNEGQATSGRTKTMSRQGLARTRLG